MKNIRPKNQYVGLFFTFKILFISNFQSKKSIIHGRSERTELAF